MAERVQQMQLLQKATTWVMEGRAMEEVQGEEGGRREKEREWRGEGGRKRGRVGVRKREREGEAGRGGERVGGSRSEEGMERGEEGLDGGRRKGITVEGRKEWEPVTIKSCLLQMREKVRSQLGKRRPL